MTRKDYILIAAALKEAMDSAANSTSSNLALRASRRAGVHVSAEILADALGRDNPRFDRERFLKAAGVQS